MSRDVAMKLFEIIQAEDDKSEAIQGVLLGVAAMYDMGDASSVQKGEYLFDQMTAFIAGPDRTPEEVIKPVVVFLKLAMDMCAEMDENAGEDDVSLTGSIALSIISNLRGILGDVKFKIILRAAIESKKSEDNVH